MSSEQVKPRRSRVRTVIRIVPLLVLLTSLLAWHESTVRNIDFCRHGHRVLYVTGGRLEIEDDAARPSLGLTGWSLRAPLSVTPVNWKCEWGRVSGLQALLS